MKPVADYLERTYVRSNAGSCKYWGLKKGCPVRAAPEVSSSAEGLLHARQAAKCPDLHCWPTVQRMRILII